MSDLQVTQELFSMILKRNYELGYIGRLFEWLEKKLSGDPNE